MSARDKRVTSNKASIAKMRGHVLLRPLVFQDNVADGRILRSPLLRIRHFALSTGLSAYSILHRMAHFAEIRVPAQYSAHPLPDLFAMASGCCEFVHECFKCLQFVKYTHPEETSNGLARPGPQGLSLGFGRAYRESNKARTSGVLSLLNTDHLTVYSTQRR